MLSRKQKQDSDKCEEISMGGGSMDCITCSCNICLAQQPYKITPTGYVNQAMRTAQRDVLTHRELLGNAALGLSGESGEFADHIKKFIYHGHELDKDYLKKELGDILWYVALAADTLDLALEDIMQSNIDKLKRRYPGEGFESHHSINRE